MKIKNIHINNKGFAISSIMYIILVLGVLLILTTLSILSNRKMILDNIKNEAIENIYNEFPEPYMTAGLVPVIYDTDHWEVANPNKEWYNYDKQEWANAVILANGVTKSVGDPVTVEGTNPEALAMFVWIPRYEYKIEGTYGTHTDGTLGTKELPGEIEVNFISRTTIEASEGYTIHPAFKFGDKHISGIWVGKFEISHTEYVTTSMECVDENCASADNLRILPNALSLRNNAVSSFFYGIRSMSRSGNIFGLYSNKADTHMIKNSEWGAVAYLSQSKYGKYGNDKYTELDKEIYLNNSGVHEYHYTGRSGGSYGGNTAANTVYIDQPNETSQYNGYGYYTYDGYLLEYNSNTKTITRDLTRIASTTGNITGIYDMSGCTHEYVMGVFANSGGYKWSGNSLTDNSGFEGKVGDSGEDYIGLSWPDKKYYDVYKASSGTTISMTTACDNGICYGHSLSETANWYNDYSRFILPNTPWIMRGGDYGNGVNGGIFAITRNYGYAYHHYSTRAILCEAT